MSRGKLNVDENTVAVTSVIVEVTIAAQGQEFGPLPEFKDDETLNNFAQRCKASNRNRAQTENQ